MAKTSSPKKPAPKSAAKPATKAAKPVASPARGGAAAKSAAPTKSAPPSKAAGSTKGPAPAKAPPAKAPPVKAPPVKAPPAKAPPAKLPVPAASEKPATASAPAKPPIQAPVAAPAPKASTPSSAGTQTSPGAAPAALTAPDAKPQPPRPSRPPAPVTGTAAMKNLAQRNAAALRPATDLSEISAEATRILAENDAAAVLALGEAIAAERQLPASCKILDEVLAAKPELVVGLVDRFVVLVASPQKRTVQSVALALPVMARLAPARVARHLQPLTERFTETNEVGKDGLVSTFAALCMASVAYQKRLEPVLEFALSSADPKTLQRWAEIILPSLKGEPHARARAVVEGRLPAMPRPLAQPIASFLGIKLRPLTP
jgi:hypothetical protein